MIKLKLNRPLAVFDIEATGTSPRADRIVELGIVKLMPDHSRQTQVFRFNPGMPIPEEVTQIHGISDRDVAGCPFFGEKAAEIQAVFDNADLAGYNVLRYDIPMLVEEFLRVGITFDLDSRRVIDVQRIYHRREPRDLAAALSFYCGEMHLNAHGAEGDTLATIRVLEGQYERYPDLPRDVEELDGYCNPKDPTWADRTGKLKWKDGDIVLNFGRKKGDRLREVIAMEPNFAKWILRGDFPADTRKIVADMLEGRMPKPPTGPATPGPADDQPPELT